MNSKQKRLKKSYKNLCDLNLDDTEIDYINFSTYSHWRASQPQTTKCLYQEQAEYDEARLWNY